MVENKTEICWCTDIRERRHFLRVTQEDFAEMLGISQAHLSKIESGKVPVSRALRESIDSELRVRAQLRHCAQSKCEDCEPLLDSGDAPHLQIRDVKEKRLIYGVSRSELAEVSALWEDVLIKLEAGEPVEAQEMYLAQIDMALYIYRPRCPREVSIDYISFRFPNTAKDNGGEWDEHGCIKDVFENVLGIQINDRLIEREERRYHSYTILYRFMEITLRFSPKADSGVLLEMKGRGCRVFESILQAQNRTWYDFLQKCVEKGCVATRLDIAIDDTVGLLSVSELIEKYKGGLFDFGRLQAVKEHGSNLPTALAKWDAPTDMGRTLHIGSGKSPLRFCLYQKDFEQAKKQQIPIADMLGAKNRLEIRLRDDRAQNALLRLAEPSDIVAMAYGIVSEKLQFFTTAPDGEPQACPRWQRFLGDGWANVKLTTRPEELTDERINRWIQKQCAPTLKYVLMRDMAMGENFLNDSIQNAVLSPRHEVLLACKGIDIGDMIVPEIRMDERRSVYV